jgi:hypothetical protein
VSSGYIPAKDEPGPEEILEALEELSPEERHRIYKLLRLGVRFRPEWALKITGIFSEVGEEAECDLSSCKPSSLGV